jgi:protein required for attachment to host cells
MTTTCIIVADGARARFITLHLPEDPKVEGGARLVEHEDLVNPEADVPQRGLFSDRAGRAHASPVGAAHALDDHREDHQRETTRRYVRRVVEHAERFVSAQQATRLLFVAEPRLLGTWREQLPYERFRGVEVVEVGENVSRRPLEQIQSVLALRGVVPAARAPEGAMFRPRGQAPAR